MNTEGEDKKIPVTLITGFLGAGKVCLWQWKSVIDEGAVLVLMPTFRPRS